MIVLKQDKNWRISTYAITAVLVILGFIVLRYADKHLLPRSKAVINSGRPKLLSLGGVVFRMPSEEAMVFPSNYLSKEDMRARVPNVQNFSLCAHLPDLTFHGDPESLRGCKYIGYREGDWVIAGLVGRSLGGPAPPPEKRPAETYGFSYLLQSELKETNSRNKKSFEYVAGQDMHGLHVFYPTKNIHPATYTHFWSGPSQQQVKTLIGCRGYLPQQRTKVWPTSGCHHEFYLSSDLFSGHTVIVSIHYDVRWLPQWQLIESKVRDAILGMRVDPTTINEGK